MRRFQELLAQWWVGGLIFLLPFVANPYADIQKQFDTPKIIFAFFVGNLLFAAMLARKIHPTFAYAHMAIVAISIATGFGFIQLYPLLYWISAAMAAVWFVNTTPVVRRNIFTCIVVAGVISTCHALLQMMGREPILRYAPGIPNTIPIAMFGQITKYGSFAAVAASIAFAMNLWILGLFIACGAIATKGSFAIAALAAGMAMSIRRLRGGEKLIPIMIVVGTISLALFFFLDPNAEFFFSHGRTEVWRAAMLAWWNQKFWTGFGPGSFEVIFAPYFQPKNTYDHGEFIYAHSEYVTVFFEGGLLGVSAMLAVLGAVAYYFKKEWWDRFTCDLDVCAAEAALAALLVNAIGNFSWHLSPHFLIGILSIALLLKRIKEGKIYSWPLTRSLR